MHDLVEGFAGELVEDERAGGVLRRTQLHVLVEVAQRHLRERQHIVAQTVAQEGLQRAAQHDHGEVVVQVMVVLEGISENLTESLLELARFGSFNAISVEIDTANLI